MGMLEVSSETSSPAIKIELSPNAGTIVNEEVYESIEKTTPKRKPRKKTEKVGDKEIVTSKDDDSDLPMLASNRSYKDTYMETDNILRTAVVQLDEAAAEIGEDITEIRNSKTLRNKFKYLSDLQSSRSSIISAKISAARELNNSIKNSHELELKRAKELKLTENDQDDVKSIQDMYNAFVSMPVSQNMVGPFSSPLGPNTQGLTMASDNILATMNGQDPEIGYQNYLNNMSPEQATMMIEENPHINHVVAYDPATGNAQFAVYDSQSNRFLDNLPTRNNEMFMPNMQFDFENMQAVSNNLNESFDIVNINNVSNGGGINMVSANPTGSGTNMDNY